ncbi:MAG: hypothetical protein LUQ65_00525 [Candidatus Helarchaeota archaeon]|nr:hypothetical protein [Candidatus Helarchaeota archaeon]
MAKGKKAPEDILLEKDAIEKSTGKSALEIFKLGMNFENTIEYIESKLLDAFFGHICRQNEWELAQQYILNVKEWCQSLQTTAKLELNFLPDNLQEKIIKTGGNLEVGIDTLLKAISQKNFDNANKELENILRDIRELYKLRE